MGETSNSEATGGLDVHESYGVLVGWTHSEFNDRFDLRLQSIQSTRCDEPEDADSHHFMMTRNQAVVLANYLFQITHQTPPRPRKRGILMRLFGG